ncbi:MAG: CYTH and CHAD domain-containing protein [Candidatus Nanopelagicales bacterium]
MTKPTEDPDPAEPDRPEVVREVERKLRVGDDFALPELAGAVKGVATVEPGDPVTLRAVYHDTEDLRLFRWKVTLRRREGGSDAGWHLKLPVDGEAPGVRDEVRLPLRAGRVGRVPAALSDIVTALVRGAPLVPVVALTTVRTPYLLLDADGHAVAELVDDRVTVSVGDEERDQFREIEVEALEPAGNAVVDRVADLLVSLGATPSAASKAASALGAAAAQPPDVPEPGRVRPKDPAGDAVRAHLATHVRRLLLQDVRMRRDLPDAVHQMRVAARRLRSGLREFAPLVDSDWGKQLRDELGWIAGELGLARDTEVLLERLDEHADHLAPADAARARAAIDPWLRARLESGRTAGLAALRTDRYLALLGTLVDAAAAPQLTDAASARCSKALPPLVAQANEQLIRDVKRLKFGGASRRWHRARITAKRARYAAEAAVPVFGRRAERVATALEQVTELLGLHQDAYVGQTTLRELSTHDGVDGPTGFALGLLHAVEEQNELVYRLDFEEMWPGVRRTLRRTTLD